MEIVKRSDNTKDFVVPPRWVVERIFSRFRQRRASTTSSKPTG